MTVPAPLVFPGSRTLAGWWRQLAPWQPRSWWVGHLLWHRVEALTLLTRTTPLEPLSAFALRALGPGTSLAALDARLHLSRPLLGQLLRLLQSAALVTETAGTWTPTDLGRRALQQGAYPRTLPERRSFYFTEAEDAGQPPHYLRLEGTACVPWQANHEWRFDIAWLTTCVGQPEEWKQRFGFPLDVQDILTGAGPAAAAAPEWQRAAVDYPERLAAVLVQAADGRLLGFAVRPEAWELRAEAPVFTLDEHWPEVFPRLAEPLPAENWRQAWQTWCQPRGLAGLGAEACPVEPAGHLLRVRVPPRLMERLRTTRSDALKGEAWLLAGAGRLRSAALLEVVEENARAALRQA